MREIIKESSHMIAEGVESLLKGGEEVPDEVK